MTAIIAITGATIFAFSLGAFVGWNARRNHEAKRDYDNWTEAQRERQFQRFVTYLNGERVI